MFSTDCLHDGAAIVTDSDMPNVRWTVWQDESSDSPNEWHTDIAYVFNTSYRGNTDDPGDELSEVFYRVYSENHDEDFALKVTRRSPKMDMRNLMLRHGNNGPVAMFTPSWKNGTTGKNGGL